MQKTESRNFFRFNFYSIFQRLEKSIVFGFGPGNVTQITDTLCEQKNEIAIRKCANGGNLLRKSCSYFSTKRRYSPPFCYQLPGIFPFFPNLCAFTVKIYKQQFHRGAHDIVIHSTLKRKKGIQPK